MAQSIRAIGLKLVLILLRRVERPARSGWQPSRRPISLRGR
jgi:hypothetical protein